MSAHWRSSTNENRAAASRELGDRGGRGREPIGPWSLGRIIGVVVRREVIDHDVGDSREAIVDTRREPDRSERVDDHAVRSGGAFVTRSVDDDAVAFGRVRRRFARQSTLADSGRADHEGEAWGCVVGQECIEPAELFVASEDPRSPRVVDRCRERQRGHRRCDGVFGAERGAHQLVGGSRRQQAEVVGEHLPEPLVVAERFGKFASGWNPKAAGWTRW